MSGKQKLLITGGLGNIGSWLSEYFSENFDIYVLSKNINNKLDCNYTLLQADITNLDDLKSKLTEEFDFCIHAASCNEVFQENYAKKALKVNALGTRNLIEVLKNTSIKNFIYLSTFHVYGKSFGLISEESDLNPKNDYATSHLFAEYYLKQFLLTDNFQSIIFRVTNCYGAPKFFDTSKWYLILNDLVRSAFENQKIILKSNGNASRDFIWIRDVCKVLHESLTFDKSSTYNLSSGITFKMMDLALAVQNNYKKRYGVDINIVSNKKDKTTYSELKVDNSKLKKIVSFEFNDKLNHEINLIFNLLESNLN